MYEEIAGLGTDAVALLSMCDVLVDGRYQDARRSLTLRFRGSHNQRLIDLNATRAQGEVVLLSGE